MSQLKEEESTQTIVEEEKEEMITIEEEGEKPAKPQEEEQIDTTPWIFFDYSGTLVDTVRALAESYTAVLGREFTTEEVKSLYKDYPKMAKLAIMRKYKINPLKYLFGGNKKFEAIRKEKFWEKVRAFPGIAEVLMRLKKLTKTKIAIVTHETEIQDEEKREEILQHFGLPSVFEEVISDKKNKEEVFKNFVTEKGIKKAIFVGDTQFDLELGKSNGFYTIGVTWGFSSREEFNADYIIDDPREMLQIIISLFHQMEQETLHGDPKIR